MVVVIAIAWVQSLVQELLHATTAAKNIGGCEAGCSIVYPNRREVCHGNPVHSHHWQKKVQISYGAGMEKKAQVKERKKTLWAVEPHIRELVTR